MAFAKILMAVFTGAALIFTVINVKYCDLVKTEYAVKFFHYPIIVIHKIISRVIDVAGVKTDTELFGIIAAIINCF